MKKSSISLIIGMFLSIIVFTIAVFAKSPIEGVSDEAYDKGLELLSQFAEEDYREDLAGKLNNLVKEQFDNDIGEVTAEEIGNAVNKEEYVQDTLEKIGEIGVSRKEEDLNLMTYVFATYMLTLDNAWARGPEGGEKPCSSMYRFLVIMNGPSDKEDQEMLMDLDTLLEFFYDTYANSADMSGIEYALSLSNFSMFHPEQINLIK